MVNYRRLISYIYAYEGDIKGKNIGFAKLEARNGQCKIQVSVRKIYVGNQDIGVYLLAGIDEIFLGKMFVRGGCGEFRIIVPYGNIAGTGKTIEQCHGLTVHGVDDSWRSYTTIWEDAVAHAAELDLGEATAQKASEREMNQIPDTQITDQKLKEVTEGHKDSVVELIEKEINAQNESQWHGLPPFQKDVPEQMKKDPVIQPVQPQESLSKVQPTQPQESPVEVQPTQPQEPPVEVQPTQPQEPPAEVQPTQPQEPQAKAQPSQPQEPQASAKAQEDGKEGEESDSEKLWQHFQRHYPKIQAFDYNGSCEILLIKPQDIGLLPRETWNYGNNSFLLHGYYNYRYLILARLIAESGEMRFLLGIPGHYYSNEKYMATMFGFPNFVLSKMQPANDSRFGYWYTDIRLEN